MNPGIESRGRSNFFLPVYFHFFFPVSCFSCNKLLYYRRKHFSPTLCVWLIKTRYHTTLFDGEMSFAMLPFQLRIATSRPRSWLWFVPVRGCCQIDLLIRDPPACSCWFGLPPSWSCWWRGEIFAKPLWQNLLRSGERLASLRLFLDTLIVQPIICCRNLCATNKLLYVLLIIVVVVFDLLYALILEFNSFNVA